MAALEDLREALGLGTLSSEIPNMRACVTTAGIGAGGGMMISGTSLSGGSVSISDGDVSTGRTPNTSACFSTSRFHYSGPKTMPSEEPTLYPIPRVEPIRSAFQLGLFE